MLSDACGSIWGNLKIFNDVEILQWHGCCHCMGRACDRVLLLRPKSIPGKDPGTELLTYARYLTDVWG